MTEFHGRFPGGFAWMARPDEFMERSSTAFAENGRVWLIDPVRSEGVEDEVAALGKVAAIVMSVGWHDRDVDWYAAMYGVPVYAHASLRLVDVHSPVERIQDRVPNSPLHAIPCGGRGLLKWWGETAIWWPEHRALVAGDALGTASYFVQPGEQVAVHPFRRLSPPVALRSLPVERLYVGHGRSLATDAAAQVQRAIDNAGRDVPRALWYSLTSTAGFFTGRR